MDEEDSTNSVLKHVPIGYCSDRMLDMSFAFALLCWSKWANPCCWSEFVMEMSLRTRYGWISISNIALPQRPDKCSPAHWWVRCEPNSEYVYETTILKIRPWTKRLFRSRSRSSPWIWSRSRLEGVKIFRSRLKFFYLKSKFEIFKSESRSDLAAGWGSRSELERLEIFKNFHINSIFLHPDPKFSSSSTPDPSREVVCGTSLVLGCSIWVICISNQSLIRATVVDCACRV